MAPLAFTSADAVDLTTLAVVGLFLAWGAMRGALRQALGLVAIVVGLVVASGFSPRLVGATRRIVTLSTEGTACVAWAAVFLGTLVLCGLAIHAWKAPLDRIKVGRGMDPWFGGAVGFVKAVLLLSVAYYAVLGANVGEPGNGLVAALRSSRSARAVVRFQSQLSSLVPLPAAVASRVEAVNAEVRPSLSSQDGAAPRPPPEDDETPVLARPRAPR